MNWYSYGFPSFLTKKRTQQIYSEYSNNQYFLIESYYYNRFGVIPHTIDCDSSLSNIFDWIWKNDYKTITEDGDTNKNGLINTYKVYYLKKYRAIIKVSRKNDVDGTTYYSIKAAYSGHHHAGEFENKIKSFYTTPEEQKKAYVYIIVEERGSLTAKPFEVKVNDIDIPSHYGKSFEPVYNKILTRLNTDKDKGIVLFHGLPGTGKTSLIKYISKNVTKNVIFLPNSMASSLDSPSFIPFLIERPNSILIIEDAEKVVGDRTTTNGYGTSNILNISDGILGDCLNIQIIATFNTNRDKIDSALLRKGRLIAEYEFGKLSVKESNNPLSKMGSFYTTNSPMTLADIYNFEEHEYKKQESKIGFELPQSSK